MRVPLEPCNCSRSENGTSGEVCLDVSFITAVILVTLTSFLFVLACITLIVYYKWRLCCHIVETRIGIVIFCLGALLTVITTLSSYTEKSVYTVYLFFLLIFCGMGVLPVGSAVLFENASPDRSLGDYSYERLPVGHRHGSIGLIVWVVTAPLSILELLFAICAAKHAPFNAYAPLMYIALVQKIIQAKVYHFSLRHKVAKRDMRMGCSWLMKIISVFNFAFWIDWIVTAQSDNEFVVHLFGNGFSVVKAAYNALLIDYRLLCGLLFLEHSLELMETRTNQHVREILDLDPDASEALMQDCYNVVVNVEISHSAGYGYVIGSLVMSTQLIAGLQYLGYVGNWSNIFPVITCVVVVVFGFLLLSVNSSTVESGSEFTRKNWRETESKAIDVMVCFMGTIGFIFWFMKASYCCQWAYKYSTSSNTDLFEYLIWTTLKDFSYAITVIFQLYFFVKMGPHFGCDRESSRLRAKQFYVCTIMMALLSLVVSFVVDEYDDRVEELLAHAYISNTMSTFLQAAGPIHLGFSLHMFLHFFIMNRRLAQFQYNWRHRQTPNSQHCPQSSTGNNYYQAETKDERQPLISHSGHQWQHHDQQCQHDCHSEM